MEEMLKYFTNVSDPRSYRNQRHPLVTLIGTTLLASLSGIDSFSGFADFTESHIEVLQDYFEFPNGVPSHDTYQRFWDAVNPEEFYNSFCELTETLATMVSDIISVDGKACIRNDNAAENIDILRKWALNVLQKVKQKPDQSIKSIMRKNAMSSKHLLATVKKIFHA